ncbi:MAG: DEAD/DEAH box helicase [Proteobacteria bacterium]|nr:DEAD/DEAH box helicase [Pseudomonadota bacterium]
MKLTTYQISEAFDFGAYSRGKQYFLNDEVISCIVISSSADKAQLISKVAGSYKSFYVQTIMITHIKHRKTAFQGDCSCPVGYNCKHVVAACFQYQHDITYKPEDRVADWLDKLLKQSSTTANTDNREDDAFFLVYRLFEMPYNDELTIYKSKILKNGNLSRGVKSPTDNVRYSLSQYMDNNDKEAVELLASMRDYRYNFRLKGKPGYLFIMQLLNTGRCFYKDSTTPLTLAAEKMPLQFEWLKIDNKRSKLHTIMATDNFHVVPTKPILVINIDNGQVSELDSSINMETLDQLIDAPAIPNKKINSVYQTLASNFHSLELPTPKGYTLTTIKQQPIPLLHIYQQENNSSVEYLLNIEFIYADHVIGYLPVLPIYSQFDNAGKIDVVRDNSAEKAAITQLTEFGFVEQQLDGVFYLAIPADNNTQLALQQWNKFLNTHIATLKKSGWEIKFNDNFELSFNSISAIEVESEEDNDWFSLSFNIKFGNKSYPLAPLVSSILYEYNEIDDLPENLLVECDPSEFVELKTQEIKPVLKTLFELFDRRDTDTSLKISAFDAHMIDDIENAVSWKGSKEILKLSKKLKNFAGIKNVKPPKCLKLELRDYQQLGLNWLNFLYEFKFSGILADDMGLGKTAQTLAHLSRLKQLGKLKKPAIIVVPTSLIANWKNEVKKFTPNLNIVTLYGNDRFKHFNKADNYDLILTTYTLVGNDIQEHGKRKHSYIILDEAQKIKNPRTKMAKTICTLKGEHRLALTGTPIENHLGELWSIFNFLMPGFLHNQKLFNEYYRHPIEKAGDTQMQAQLNKRIKPFILRRTKSDVLTELPAKTEIIKLTQFDNKQSKLYETIRISMQKKVRDAVAEKGLNKSHIHILDALLKLRQVCCDPSILKLKEAQKVKESAKLQLFLDLTDELLLEGRKILVFSQFTSMLAILENEIIKRKISYVKLTGSSTKRDKIIEKFTNGEADIFLISLKAGGVGLNLVEADTVIHYDPWWNPAVENQATDRAHRIGQDKAVFVYKLIVENTIEQKIIELQKKKKALQDGIYDQGGKLEDKKFSGNELMDLLKS